MPFASAVVVSFTAVIRVVTGDPNSVCEGDYSSAWVSKLVYNIKLSVIVICHDINFGQTQHKPYSKSAFCFLNVCIPQRELAGILPIILLWTHLLCSWRKTKEFVRDLPIPIGWVGLVQIAVTSKFSPHIFSHCTACFINSWNTNV